MESAPRNVRKAAAGSLAGACWCSHNSPLLNTPVQRKPA
jgi:hypothetical protein